MRRMEFHPCPEGLKKAGEVRPVVVLFGWLLAKSRHLHKYGELYHHYGADVITVKLEVMEVGYKAHYLIDNQQYDHKVKSFLLAKK